MVCVDVRHHVYLRTQNALSFSSSFFLCRHSPILFPFNFVELLAELYHDLFVGLVASHSLDVVLDGLGEAGASGQPASDLGPRLSVLMQLEATRPRSEYRFPAPSSKLCQI